MLCAGTICDSLNLNYEDIPIALKFFYQNITVVSIPYNMYCLYPYFIRTQNKKKSNILNLYLLFIVNEGIFLKFNTIFGSEIIFSSSLFLVIQNFTNLDIKQVLCHILNLSCRWIILITGNKYVFFKFMNTD